MPHIIDIKGAGNLSYKIVSTIGDTIEKLSPAMWFRAYAYVTLTRLHGLNNKEAGELSNALLTEWENKSCPVFLLALFDTKNKRQQERLLRNQSITPESLIGWILQGGQRGGLFSQYSFDGGSPEGLQGRTPIMIDATDKDEIKTIGKTSLSSAALLHIVENQIIVIAQFIDLPDGSWYCIYRTRRGLTGREPGHQGQHFHFISSAYGVDRNTIVEGFKRGKCPKNGFHVHLSGYHEDETYK